MNVIIFATFQDGLLKPEQPLDLPSGARVRIIVEPMPTQEDKDKAWEELEKLWDETHIDSGGNLLTRDQLHERR